MAKSTSVNTNTSNADFLAANHFLFERVKMGIDIYPSEIDLTTFAEIAKKINPQINFQIKGCQECVQSLISFVYNNSKVETETIPTESEGKE